jgi:hypothetical protein
MFSILKALLCLAIPNTAIAADPLWILPNSPKYKAAVADLNGIIRDSLRDAKSAQIEPMLVCAYASDLKVGIARVNARNSFGAYTGFTTMIAFQDATFRRTLVANSNPRGPEQHSEQKSLLQLLKACGPAIEAYDLHRSKGNVLRKPK